MSALKNRNCNSTMHTMGSGSRMGSRLGKKKIEKREAEAARRVLLYGTDKITC